MADAEKFLGRMIEAVLDDTRALKAKTREIDVRLTSIDGQLTALRQDLAGLRDYVHDLDANLSRRLDRIERVGGYQAE